MYHWYILLKKKCNSELVVPKEEKLVWNNDDPRHFLRGQNESKLFWIGFIEFLPIIVGLLANEYLAHFLFPFDYVLTGVLLAILVAYIFRNEVPDQPISLNDNHHSKNASVKFYYH